MVQVFNRFRILSLETRCAFSRFGRGQTGIVQQ
jgi:hypothetical protein